jgi:predicted MFS family arabinose efflux permease
VILAAVVAVTLAMASVAGSYGWLLGSLALAGAGQALANPATNVLMGAGVPDGRQGLAVGLKQAGVQMAALWSGVVLPGAAVWWGWRSGLRLSALLALAMVLAVVVLVPARAETAGPRGPWWRWPRAPRWMAWLTVYCLLLACGNAAVATYLPLYATQSLGVTPLAAGAVLAAFGLAGVVGRVGWAVRADRLPRPMAVLAGMSAAAAACTLLVYLSDGLWVGLAWFGAVGLGGSAVAAYAVAMLSVLKSGEGATGYASGLVSLGFFGGFALGPLGFGVLADRAGYGWGWIAVALMFVASALAALPFRALREISPEG